MADEFLKVSNDNFRPPALSFTDYAEILPFCEGLAFSEPLVLVGPAGVGKSIGLAHFAHKIESPLITYGCAEDSRRSHLVGNHIIRGGDSPFVLGAVTTAIEVANEMGKAILCFEEINALSPQTQKTLNGLLDYRQGLDVAEAGRSFKLKDGAKLWVTGTMNFSVYGGVYELNEDFKSRFEFLSVGYPNSTTELKLIKSEVADIKISDTEIKQIIQLAAETRKGSNKGVIDYAMSPRDTVRLTRLAGRLGMEKALTLALNKFDGDDRAVVKAAADRLF